MFRLYNFRLKADKPHGLVSRLSMYRVFLQMFRGCMYFQRSEVQRLQEALYNTYLSGMFQYPNHNPLNQAVPSGSE